MEKSTSLSATTPPKRSVTWSTWSRTSDSVVSDIGGSLLGFFLAVAQLPRSSSVGNEPLRSRDHDDDEREPEDQRPVERDAVPQARERAKPLRDVAEQEGAEDDARHVAR